MQETEQGASVIELMESVQPFSREKGNPAFPNWFPLLIAITNQHKSGESVPLLEDIRKVQHPDQLLFFQVGDRAFDYQSFAENAIAMDFADRLELSKQLLTELKRGKILNSLGRKGKQPNGHYCLIMMKVRWPSPPLKGRWELFLMIVVVSILHEFLVWARSLALVVPA